MNKKQFKVLEKEANEICITKKLKPMKLILAKVEEEKVKHDAILEGMLEKYRKTGKYENRLNSLHDTSDELTTLISNIETSIERRKWKSEDFMSHSLICQNID